jgi:hypothetical protein
MASRGYRLGSRIAHDNGGLMHNLRADLGGGNRKEHCATGVFGGTDAAVATLIIAILGGRKCVGPNAARLRCHAGTRRPEVRGAPTTKDCKARRRLSSIVT